MLLPLDAVHWIVAALFGLDESENFALDLEELEFVGFGSEEDLVLLAAEDFFNFTFLLQLSQHISVPDNPMQYKLCYVNILILI